MSKSIRISIERGGEVVETNVPEGSSVSALIEDDHLRGIAVASTRVNGRPATASTQLNEGDAVSQVPTSGKQGS